MNNNILTAIQKSAELFADHTALIIGCEHYSYSQLMRLAYEMADDLRGEAEREQLDCVAFYADRSLNAYVSVLASMLVGATFVPLNPKMPEARNQEILEQVGPQDDDVGVSGNDDKTLYILFTSGSTGQPKGVPICHGNVMSFIQFCQARYQITPHDRLSQTFEQTFDLAIFDLFMAWCHGACVVAMKPIDLLAPSSYINDNKITVWFSVPSVIGLMQKQDILHANDFPTLRLSLFCGEPILESQIQAWSEAAPNSLCENLYGPTELTIACSVYQYQRNQKNQTLNNVLSIGEVFPHLDWVLLGHDGSISELEGQLCVSGDQCFEGYLNQPEANKSAFITLNNKRYYQTGDRVQVGEFGQLLYLGRSDHQVKVNGYRVELGEIEAVLSRMPGLERAVVLFDGEQLSAFVVGETTQMDVMQFAANTLPRYMVPRRVRVEKSFPLNANGKIDRKQIQSEFLKVM